MGGIAHPPVHGMTSWPVAGVLIGVLSVDATAEKLILYGAALTAVGIFWRYVARPFGQAIKAAVHIVKRTAKAVDLLEHLPARWRENDERLSAVEAEVGIAHAEILAVDGKVDGVANQVAAIRREIGIGDEQVRKPPTT